MPTNSGPGRAGDPVEADIGFAERRSDTTITPNAAMRAVWGEPRQQRPRTIALVAWRPYVKGALRGFATIELPIGLRLVECAVLASNGRAWVNLPAKAVLDRDGRQKTDANGKPAFAAILEWRSHELSDRFSEVVIAADRQIHPSALDEAEP